MNGHTIFRKSSLERVSSPEQLNDYIRVTRPGIWLVLAAVIILLIGLCVWATMGTLTITQKAAVAVEGGVGICYLTPDAGAALAPGMQVRVGETVGTVSRLPDRPQVLTLDDDPYALYLGGLAVGDWAFAVEVALAVPDGVYTAIIMTKQIAPISFVLN